MPYLVHTAHAQLVGLWLGAVGWILIIMSLGLIEWRVWEVSDRSLVPSGLAWVGIWRVCYYSHSSDLSENEIMFCQKIRPSESFTPSEIAAAQVMMLAAMILGLMGNASALYGLRNVYFGLSKYRPIRLAFSAGGGLYILSGVSTLVPVFWNLNSVVNNQTISFPPAFHMPPAPVNQYIGAGITVGIAAAVLVVCSGVIFLCYRFPVGLDLKVGPSCSGEQRLRNRKRMNSQGRDNPAFTSQESS